MSERISDTNDNSETLKQPSGILYLFGAINTESVQSLIREIIGINQKRELDFIQLLINSDGGAATDGWALIDIMRWSRLPIYTTGLGMVASMGLLVFMAGAQGHRILTPRTSILSHRYKWGRAGTHSDLVAVRKEEDLEYARVLNHYLEFSNLKVKNDIERSLLRESDTWLSAQEAVEFGLADRVEGGKLTMVRP